MLVLALALVAAGCGVRNTKPFSAGATASCLRSHGFTSVTTDSDRGRFHRRLRRSNGGLRGRSPSGNVLTIAFASDAKSTGSTEDAFRSHAPKSLRPHISDIMETNRNAVLVWTTTPASDELDTASRCLRP